MEIQNLGKGGKDIWWVKLVPWGPSSPVGSFSAIFLYRGYVRRPRKERIFPEESSALRMKLAKANVSISPVNQKAIEGTTVNNTNTTSELSRLSRKSQSSKLSWLSGCVKVSVEIEVWVEVVVVVVVVVVVKRTHVVVHFVWWSGGIRGSHLPCVKHPHGREHGGRAEEGQL